jgi:hypothetical protein
MKKSLLNAAVLIFALAMISLTTGCREDVFQVNDIVSDPGAFSESLSLEGIVYKFAQGDRSIVGIMDKKELQCTTPNCNKALLAVRVPGPQLAIGDEVKVSGTITKESWGYILKAEQVEVITKHKLGA